jgi:hypothetical protein
VRHVGRDELGAVLNESRDEMHIPREPVELRNDERRALALAHDECRA